MPPKVKVTKDEIVRAAVTLVRKSGGAALGARNVAAELGCSTQPIFSNFATMEELSLEVVKAAEALYSDYLRQEMEQEKYPPYKASGMAYIRFAGEEKELFKLLYMRDRAMEAIPEETELGNQMEGFVSHQIGLNKDMARLFHLEMWVFVHGIAAMMATGYLELEEELVSRMLTDAYQGLKKRFEEE